MERKILICFFTSLISIFSIVIIIITKFKYTNEEILNVVNSRIQNTVKIIVACDISHDKRRKNNNINSYNLGKLEKIKIIDDKREVETLVNLIKSVSLYEKDELRYGGTPICVYQFFDEKNKLLEYDLEKVTLDRLNNTYVINLPENQQKLKEYMLECMEKYEK